MHVKDKDYFLCGSGLSIEDFMGIGVLGYCPKTLARDFSSGRMILDLGIGVLE